MTRRNKYNVAPAERRTYNGVVYDSRAEMLYAQQLDQLKQVGHVLEIERQPQLELVEGYRYRPDFKVTWQDGVEYVDVKGKETTEFRRTLRMWKVHMPGHVLRVVAQRGTTKRPQFVTTRIVNGPESTEK